MAAEIRFLAIDGEAQEILDWFRRHPLQGRENSTMADRVVLWYESEGPLAYQPTEMTVADDASSAEKKRALLVWWQQEQAPGQRVLDMENTPLVWITVPHKLRGVLWTAGEVMFTGTPIRTRFPRLASLHRSFVRWLRQFELVYDPRNRRSDFDYYLEGTIRAYDSEVRALPKAMAALRHGQYFVNAGLGEDRVDLLCRQLKLRGVDCQPL